MLIRVRFELWVQIRADESRSRVSPNKFTSPCRCRFRVHSRSDRTNHVSTQSVLRARNRVGVVPTRYRAPCLRSFAYSLCAHTLCSPLCSPCVFRVESVSCTLRAAQLSFSSRLCVRVTAFTPALLDDPRASCSSFELPHTSCGAAFVCAVRVVLPRMSLHV